MIRDMKKIILFIVSLLVPFCFGQVEYKEEKTKINSIKRNSAYVYGEGIAETEEEALLQAEEELKKEVTILVSEKKNLKDADKIIVQAIRKNTSKVELKRGTSFRIFLYVKKDQIQNADASLLMDNPAKVSGEPKEETVVEELPEEDISIQELEDISQVEDLPEEIVEDVVATPGAITSPILSQIVSCENTDAVQELFARLKEEHKIMWGNVQADIKPAWYILVIDDNRIVAVLDKGLNNRLDLLTGKKVSLGSFSNRKKIWFILYE